MFLFDDSFTNQKLVRMIKYKFRNRVRRYRGFIYKKSLKLLNWTIPREEKQGKFAIS